MNEINEMNGMGGSRNEVRVTSKELRVTKEGRRPGRLCLGLPWF
jgi:hypothetical protein